MAMRDSFNEINITPLTDIFLVLLIIMMVIAPLLDQQGLNLTVPDIVKQEDLKDAKLITVLVTNDNKYVINDEEVPEADLESTIKNMITENPDGLVIQSEPDSVHGTVVKLMDKARNAGVKNVSVVEG